MLGERYRYDGQPIIKLNDLQQKTKEQIASKIKQGHYETEEVPCIVCEGNNFEPLSEKDRFGLPMRVVICLNCGLTQTNPRLTQTAYNEFYRTEHIRLLLGQDQEKASKEWFLDQYYHGQKIYRYLKDFLAHEITDLFVVEIGCGTGGILAYFRDQGCKATGLDLDEDCIRFGREHHDLDLRVGTLEECKLEEKVDIVIMSHVLEHLLNPSEELSLIRSFMNSTGLVYIEVPGIRNLTFIHNDMNFLRQLQIAHTYHFSLTTLRNLLNKNGFEIIKGNEHVKSIFKLGAERNTYENDYDNVISYLKRLEILRKYLPVTPYKIRHGIESAYCWLLRKTKLYNTARTIYRKMIGRTEPEDSIRKNV